MGGKLYRVLEFLRQVPNHQPVTPESILEGTRVDLSMDDVVDQRLKNNPKVIVVEEQEGSVITYAYQAKYTNLKNKHQLLKILDRVPDGIPHDDLVDCYIGVEQDLLEYVRSSAVICIRNIDRAVDVYYSRGPTFLTTCAAQATCQPNSYVAKLSKPLSSECRRGDSIQIGTQAFRISPAIKVRIDSVQSSLLNYNIKYRSNLPRPS